MSKEILAKSSGILLTDHSKRVSEVSLKILDKILSHPDERMYEIVRLSSLLHDIGKCNEIFQKLITKKLKKSKNKFHHNEIGWAFLYRYLNVDSDKLSYIINNVYWHHGITNYMGKNNHIEILDTITDKDIETMKEVLIELLGTNYILDTPRDADKNLGERTPNYYFLDDSTLNLELIIYRSCVIAADRLISKNDEENITTPIDEQLDNLITKNQILTTDDFKLDNLDIERFNKQKEIASKCEGTTIVNAPTGFGKTLLGLTWSTMSNKPLLWVVPTNSIAKSVHTSILDLKKMLDVNPTTELFLSGEVVFSDIKDNPGFESDIIITNIDNFLSPSVKTTFADKLFLTNTADVVFDEFHELVTEEALFAAFINMLSVRHRYTNSRTLLLSATPYSGIEKFWDTIGKQSTILPEKGKHYPAMHDKKYKISVVDNIDDVIMNDKPTLFMTQSINTAQRNYNTDVFNDLIHGKFRKDILNQKLDNLITNHGKTSNPEEMGSVIGTRILQISLDISFDRVMMPVTSPIDFMQGSGRCNRFGRLDDGCDILIYRLRNREENSVLNQTYSIDLSENWFDHLLNELNGKEFTLNELYDIFNKLDEEPIVRYMRGKYNESMQSLANIHPYRTSGKKKDDVVSAGGNKLRCSGNEMFYICKVYGEDTYSEPFNTKIHNSIADEFNEIGDVFTRMIATMRSIDESGDERYDYSQVLKANKYGKHSGKVNIDKLRSNAKFSNTPYIAYDRVYHPDFGIIKLNIFDEIFTTLEN